jgi:hypothetical protein
MPVIPATQEVVDRRMVVQGQWGKTAKLCLKNS